jgi:FKBP-type peptidyl-prolyl cis-trans isomerase FkpA
MKSLIALLLTLALLPAHAARSIALKKIDTVVGSGRLAMKGDTVVVQYGAWLFAPRQAGQRGASFDTVSGNESFSFKLGAGSVIPGWEEGVPGMRVGGKRSLIVPASMAFGKTGNGPVPPGANLIFEIELLDVK